MVIEGVEGGRHYNDMRQGNYSGGKKRRHDGKVLPLTQLSTQQSNIFWVQKTSADPLPYAQ